MTAADQAMRHVRGLTPEQLRALTQARLEGKDTVPVSSGYDGESAEDLVIGLLQSDELPDASRNAVLAGCKDTYGEILKQLAAIEERSDLATLQEDMTRLCRVVDVTAPPDLANQADAALKLVLDTRLPSSVRTAAVRAVLGYLQLGDDASVPFWKDVLDHRDVAAYAFQALLIIDPHSPRIDAALRTLWRKQTTEQWPVDSAFLMRRAMRARDDERLPQQVLARLRREPCWGNIANELRRRSWSEPWLTVDKQPKKHGYFESVIQNDVVNADKERLIPQVQVYENRGPSGLYFTELRIQTDARDLETRFRVNTFVAQLKDLANVEYGRAGDSASDVANG